MNDQPLDPRLEKLVALLYGELSREDEEDLRREIASDPGLRREWESLQGTRSRLGSWEVTETAPGFVLMHEEQSGSIRAGAPWTARLARFARALSWGAAACAALLLVLALGGFRVERVNGGIYFRFGKDRTPAPLAQLGPGTTSPLSPAPASQFTPVSSGGPLLTEAQPVPENRYMTKEEFRAYSDGVTQTMLALLNDYSRQRDQDVVGLVQAAYTQMQHKQSQDYDDLKTRIEAFGLGLARQQYNSDVRLDQLMKQNQGGVLRPAVETAPSGGEGGQK